MRRLLRLSLLFLLLLLVAGYWLLGSESGNRQLLAWSLGERLQVTSLQGALLQGRLEIGGLQYRDAAQQVSIGRLRLEWRPEALFEGELHIPALMLEDLRLVLAGTGEASDQPLSIPSLPLAVRLDRLRLDRIELQTPDGQWQLTAVETGLQLADQVLILSQIKANYGSLKAEGQGTVTLRDRLPVEFQLQWQGEWPQSGLVKGGGRLEGDLDGLRIEHRITSPIVLGSRGEVNLQGPQPRLDVAGEWSGLRWPLVESSRVESGAGHYRLQGPLDQLQIESGADLRLPEAPFLQQLQLSATLHPDGLRNIDLGASLERGRLELRGELDWSPGVSWNLQLSGEALDPAQQWPDWPGQLHLNSSIEGGIRDQEPWANITLQQLAGTLRGRPLELQGEGEFAGQRLQLPGLQLSSGESRLQIQGDVDLSAAARWQLTLQGEALDPAIGWPEWPGQLTLQAGLQGGMRDQEPWLELDLQRLSGTLRQQPLSLQGRAGYQAGVVDLNAIALDSGPNQIRLEGRVAETLDVDFQIDAPRLEASWPGLSGQLKGEGRLSGQRLSPNLHARLQGENLDYQGQLIERLQAAIDWDPQQAVADIQARGLSLAGEPLEHLTMTLRGTPEKHRGQLALEAREGQVNATLAGGWSDGSWVGSVQELNLVHPVAGRWGSAGASDLQVSQGSGRLERLCLNSDDGQICSRATWGQARQQVRVDLQGVPLKRLRPYMLDQGRIEGVLDGYLELQGPLGSVQGEAELALRDAALVMDLEPEPALRLGVSKGLVQASVTPQGVQGQIILQLSQGGELAGDIRLGPPAGQGVRNLGGTVRAALPDITLLELFTPGVSELEGRLEGELRLSGDTARPEIEGEMALHQGSARVPGLGLELKRGELRLRNQGTDRIVLDGGVDSGDERLLLDGVLLLDEARGWLLELTLKGEAVQLVRLPETELYVSPDLAFTVSRQQVGVQGEVRVPRARIEIRKLPESAVTVSEDEIIVGAEAPINERTTAPVIDARVRLRLGEAVSFSGFGLQSRLQGVLDLSGSEGRYLANGELLLREGRYQAYGQDLSIETGRLAFAGPPDNPALNIQATRLSRDRQVTAILDVRGTLRAPQVSVSSEPPLAEEEALAYLVTGRSIGDGGGSNAAMLRQAALTQGLDKSQAILDQIAGGIGADDFRIEEGATLEETSLLLGKYLSPDLYVSYGVGLFDKEGALMMRYRLSEHLRLEVQSGSQQGVDLFYNIERE